MISFGKLICWEFLLISLDFILSRDKPTPIFCLCRGRMRNALMRRITNYWSKFTDILNVLPIFCIKSQSHRLQAIFGIYALKLLTLILMSENELAKLYARRGCLYVHIQGVSKVRSDFFFSQIYLIIKNIFCKT